MSYIVVGSRYADSIAARFLAEKANEKVLSIEKRNHISGNMAYTLFLLILILHFLHQYNNADLFLI